MKKWMKYGVGLAALSTVAALTAACGNSSKESSNPTVLMYQIGDKPKNYDTLMAHTNKILNKKVHANLKIQYIGWGDYAKKMSVIVSSGENYDIAKADNYIVNAQKGAYADLTKLLPKYAPEAYKDLDPAYIKGNKVDGKLYAFPVNGNVFAQQTISFNKKFVEDNKLDVSQVKSYQDLAPIFEKYHKANPGKTVLATGQNFRVAENFDYVLSPELPFAVDYNEGADTTKIINPYDNAQMQKDLKTMHEFYQKGYIDKDAATNQTGYPLNVDTWFARQETQGALGVGNQALSEAAGKEMVSQSITIPAKTNSQAQMCNFVINNASKNKTLAVKVLGEINSNPELLNGLVYGEEGKAWKKVDNDRIKLLDGYKDGYHMAAWNTGNANIVYNTEAVTDQMLKDKETETKSAIESPALGFQFDSSDVKTEITNIASVMQKYLAGLNTGTSDPEKTIPEMNKELKKAGYDKVLKEMQKQYTAFKK